MKLRANFLLGVCIAIAGIGYAQKAEEKKPAPKPKPIPVYLAGVTGGAIGKRAFDDILMQKFTSKDSAGKTYMVDGFLLTYAERNLYEDSVGKLMVITDYLSEVCYGDSLTTFLKNTLRERTKMGDTVIFDQITVRGADGHGMHGKPMKFVIGK
jgi:hypothetical protein